MSPYQRLIEKAMLTMRPAEIEGLLDQARIAESCDPKVNPKSYDRLMASAGGAAAVFGEGSTRITSATTYFRNGNGPTNFSIFSDFGYDQLTDFKIQFSRAPGGDFAYTAQHVTSIYYQSGSQSGFQTFSGTITGSLTEGTVDPIFAQGLDSNGGYYDGVRRLVPTYIGPNPVPEPGSLALLAIGAIGAAGAARRRKAAR